MTSLPSVAELEAAALVAWPALEDLRDGALMARFSAGYSRRSNSIQSMDAGDDADVGQRLDALRARYDAHGLPAFFRITPLAGPAVLDVLDRQGWVEDDLNLVMAMPLRKVMRAVSALTQSFDPTDAEWARIQTAMAGTADKLAQLQAVLARIDVPARTILAYDPDLKPVAAALIVNADGIAFLLNVVVTQDMRGLGYGRAIMNAGLNWAAQSGATTAALQVQADNQAATALYGKLGFVEQYRYQYRRYPS